MKKFFNYLCLAAIAGLTLASCSKNETVENLPEKSVKKVNFSAKSSNPSTKTAFGDKTDAGYPTVWTANEKVAISLNFAAAKVASVTPSANGKTATFEATIADDESGEYTFYAISPAAAAISCSASYKSIQIDFPATQTPTLKSVDEKAHIMAAKSAAFTEFPEETTPVTLTFSHLAAYGKFQLRNLPETVTINSIELVAEEDVSGRFYFYPVDGSLAANSAGKSVILNVGDLEIDKNNTTDFWFSFKPVNLEGKTLKVAVHTDAGVYAKTITFPTGKGNFQAGHVAAFTVNMSGITPGEDQVYRIVTDKKQLLPGTKVIIVAKDADVAMSDIQNNYNRAITAVTKSEDFETITNPGSDVQIFELEAGSITDFKTVAFKCVNGDQAGKFIGSASSSYNNLLSFNDKAANTSFSVSIIAGNSYNLVYTILAANDYTRNIVRYNSGNTPPIFSCYASTSSVKNEVVLYALEGSGEGSSLIDDPKCPTPVIDYNASTKTVTITCSASEARIGYTTDGSEPGLDDTGAPTGTTQEYTEPFVISETCTVKAFAGAPGYEMSEIAEKECVVSSEVDYVTLNWSFSGLGKDDLDAIPGVTTSGLGSDYGASHDPYFIKLDSDGDYIQVKTDVAIGYVSVDYKMVGGGNTSSIKVRQSADGTTWSDVETLTISGSQNSTGTLETTNSFDSESRYVRFLFTKGSNVGIGGILISKDLPTPAPTFSITVNTCEHGSVVSSVETAKEGTEITLTATPETGYKFSSWDVKDAESNPITVTDNKFTMPASNVTVSAIFEEITDNSATFEFGVNITSTSGSINGVTLSTAKNGGNDPAYNQSSKQLRIYRYNSMTLSCASNIKSIVITYDGDNVGYEPSVNTGTYSCSDSIGTWSGSSQSVTITNNGDSSHNVQMRITKIEVTFE